jgi:hypothetical protein
MEQPAADDSADHTEADVENNSVSRLVDDFAPDEAATRPRMIQAMIVV